MKVPSQGQALVSASENSSLDAVIASATVELEQPNQLPELLTSLRSLPHVERVSKLSIDRRHKADPPGPERPESQL